MAARAGYSQRGMNGVLHRLGLPPPRARTSHGRAALTTEDLSNVVRVYRDEGLSLAQVGSAFGHRPDWARARVLATGVPMRRPGERGHRTEEDSGLDVERLTRWYADGLTLAEISHRTGGSRAKVTAGLRAYGVEIRSRRRRTTTPTPDQLRELYVDQHLTLAQVAARLGCSNRRVAARLAAAGVALRAAGRPASSPAPPPLDEAQPHELYVDQQLTIAEVATRVGSSDTRVAAALKQHGIPRRRGGTRLIAPIALDAPCTSSTSTNAWMTTP
jgi:hypothetical protein